MEADGIALRLATYICRLKVWKSVKFARFIPLLFLFSCLDDPDCLVTATNLVKIDFKNADGSARSITFSGITVSGLATPLFVNSAQSTVQLPLNPQATETTFSFREGTSTKNIVIRYAITHRAISEKCGAYAYYSNLEVIENSFTSYKVKNPSLFTSNTAANVEVVY